MSRYLICTIWDTNETVACIADSVYISKIENQIVIKSLKKHIQYNIPILSVILVV